MTKIVYKNYINIPAPATPTVAAPAPIYLAAESISFRIAVVWINDEQFVAPTDAADNNGLYETLILLNNYYYKL
jgi:hypothetical protein